MTKKIIIIICSLFLIFEIYVYIASENITQKYWDNISKVKVGMNLDEARKIIGDYEYQYWTQDNKSGEIIITKDKNNNPIYSLEYDMLFGSSGNPKIYFDPNTLSIYKIERGE